MLFKRFFAAVLLGASALAAAPACRAADGGFEASFSINRNKATIGDDLVVAADIVHDDAFKIDDLPKDLQAPPFVVKRVERVAPKKAGGLTADGFRITLTVFETGRFTVPAIPIRFRDPKGKAGVVYTEKWEVQIFSVLGDQKDGDDIRPLKDPASLETEAQRRMRWIRWAVALIGLLLLGLLGWLGWRRYEAWRESRKPAHQRALEALDRLEKKHLLVTGQPKMYYGELTDILKTYLIRRYAVGSPDQTTREFLAAVESKPEPAAEFDSVRSVLAAADLVKFARALPTGEEAQASADEVRALIRRTVPAEPAARKPRRRAGAPS